VAVSMNAGFMRSDYMISDAALPMRMDELEQLEQASEFSSILGEMGKVTANEAVPVDADTAKLANTVVMQEQPSDNASALSKEDLKELAMAVVRGEMKLDEIPEEYVTDVLVMVIAMMLLGIPEDEIPALEEASEDTEAVEPVRLDIATAEAFINVVRENDEAQVTLDIIKTIQGQTEQLDIPQEMKQALTKQIQTVIYTMNEHAAQAATPESADVNADISDIDAAELPAGVEAIEAVTEQAVTNNSSAQQQQMSQQDTAQAAQRSTQTARTADTAKLDEEFEQLRKAMTDFTVKKTEHEQQNNAVQTNVVENTSKSRLVSKSDELMLLKNAAKPTVNDVSVKTAVNEANAEPTGEAILPQTVSEQLPAVFTRPDGTEISVKPEEVVRQVATSIIEQTTVSAEGDTEYSVTLNPEDLGSITVKLTKTIEGSLSVSIMADNAKTQRLIEQNSAAIQQGLRENGIELESWQTVNESQQENRAEDYNGSSKNPYYHAEEDTESADEGDNSFAELISAM